MDQIKIDEFITDFLQLDPNKLSVEKRREISIQLRSLQLERESNKASIQRWLESYIAKVNWHFEQVMSHVEPFKDITVGKLKEQNLLHSFTIKIPLPSINKMKHTTTMSGKRVRPQMKSLRKLHSTLTSVNMSLLPHFGNISLIKPANTTTTNNNNNNSTTANIVTYKGSRRNSMKKAILMSSMRRSSASQRHSKCLTPDERKKMEVNKVDEVEESKEEEEEDVEYQKEEDEQEAEDQVEEEETNKPDDPVIVSKINVEEQDEGADTLVQESVCLSPSKTFNFDLDKNHDKLIFNLTGNQNEMQDQLLQELRAMSDYSSIQEFLQVYEQKVNNYFDGLLAHLDPVLASTCLQDLKNVEFCF